MKIFILTGALIFTLGALAESNNRLVSLGQIADFTLTNKDGASIQKKDLLGKVWAANFIFTRCMGPCPILSNAMSELQKKTPKETVFVSFSVDPNYDTPPVLLEYARRFNARSQWLFLTGEKEKIYGLLENSFHIGAHEDLSAVKAEDRFIHSTYFVLVDPEGTIRGYYEGTNSLALKKLSSDIKILTVGKHNPKILRLPLLNAGMNGTAAFLLLAGFHAIRRKKITLHKFCMASAFVVSLAFLGSYLTYHFYVGSVPYMGTGWIRTVYFTILISHTILAAVTVPLAGSALYQAWKTNFQKHVRIARFALPIWLYVSTTGVTIYWMLYRF